MSEETVKLTADAVWQDGTPFSGYLEVTLLETGTTANSLVAPKKAQEIAFENGWIGREEMLAAAERFGKSEYGKHLLDVAQGKIVPRKERR